MIEIKAKMRDIAAIICLAVGVIACFGKVIVSKDTLYGSDFAFYFYPTKRFIYEYFCANGSIPFWNPYLFSGTPLIVNMQASMFYPLGFLYYLIPADAAYLYSTLLHAMLGAIFMYVFVRSLGTSRAGAFLSGFIFAFNGFFIAHIYAGHLSLVQNYIWIPLIFLFARRFMETREMKQAVAGGLVLGIQILGGFPQIAFYTMLSVLLLCFYFSCLNYKRNGLPYICRISAGTVLLLIIGFLISAIQLLPTYEFTQLSTRSGGIDYTFATLDSLPPANLLTFLFPLIFGSPADGTYWISDRSWEFWEFCGYVGVGGLAAILLSMRTILRDRMGLFFVLLAVMSLFLAFGKYNPIYPLIYRLPGFNSFRIPAQILFLYVFSLSVLIGKAADILRAIDLFQNNARRGMAVILFFAFPLVTVFYVFPDYLYEFISRHRAASTMNAEQLRLTVSVASRSVFISYCIFFAFSVCWYLKTKGSISRTVFTWMLIGLCIIDLWSFAFPLIQPFDIRPLLAKGQALSHIARASQISRSVIDGNCFIENAGLWYGFQDIQGYDPLILRRYVEYINRSQGLPPDNKVVNLHYIRNVNNALIRMLNLKYVVDCQDRQIRVYDGFMPRCWIVHQSVEMESDQVLDFMMGKDFNPSDMVVFARNEAPSTAFFTGPSTSSEEMCCIVSYDNEDIRVRVNLNMPGFLVLSEMNYPGWQAFVDGKSTPILRGNYLFRVLLLPAGRHEILMTFSPLSFQIGACISLAALLVLGVFVFSPRGKTGH